MGANGNLGKYGDYATAQQLSGDLGVDDVKMEDVMKLSGDALAGMASAGLITSAMAQQVLSQNPNLSEDKKIMLGAIAAGKTTKGMNAEQFKKDAIKIMNNYASGAGSAGTINGQSIDKTMVRQWVAPPQQRVFISQNDQGGYYEQDQPVRVTLDGPEMNIPHGTPPTPTVGPGPTPPPTSPPTPTVGSGPTPPPTPPPATGGSI